MPLPKDVYALIPETITVLHYMAKGFSEVIKVIDLGSGRLT